MVVSAVEHSAVKRNAEVFGERGLDIVTIPVDGEGRLDHERLMQAIDERCALVSLMWANNETGVLTDRSGVADACRRRRNSRALCLTAFVFLFSVFGLASSFRQSEMVSIVSLDRRFFPMVGSMCLSTTYCVVVELRASDLCCSM